MDILVDNMKLCHTWVIFGVATRWSPGYLSVILLWTECVPKTHILKP